jgi:hypothetical protein
MSPESRCGAGLVGQSGVRAQPATLIVSQSDATAVELRLEGPILFTEEVDDIPLLSLDPTKECHEQKVEWEQASESIRVEVDGVSGHYSVVVSAGRSSKEYQPAISAAGDVSRSGMWSSCAARMRSCSRVSRRVAAT